MRRSGPPFDNNNDDDDEVDNESTEKIEKCEHRVTIPTYVCTRRGWCLENPSNNDIVDC